MLRKDLNDDRVEPQAREGGVNQPSADQLLAARDAACAALASQQVALAEVVQRQNSQLSQLKEELNTVGTSLKARYAEIANLSLIVMNLENAKALADTTHAGEVDALAREREELARKAALSEYEAAARGIASAKFEQALSRLSSPRTRFGRWLLRRNGAFAEISALLSSVYEDDIATLNTSDLFDSSWYVKQHPEAEAMRPAEHYLKIGSFRGFNPSPHFDGPAYLVRYPDVRYAGLNPLVHFLRYGQEEGRTCGSDGP